MARIGRVSRTVCRASSGVLLFFSASSGRDDDRQDSGSDSWVFKGSIPKRVLVHCTLLATGPSPFWADFSPVGKKRGEYWLRHLAVQLFLGAWRLEGAREHGAQEEQDFMSRLALPFLCVWAVFGLSCVVSSSLAS